MTLVWGREQVVCKVSPIASISSLLSRVSDSVQSARNTADSFASSWRAKLVQCLPTPPTKATVDSCCRTLTNLHFGNPTSLRYDNRDSSSATVEPNLVHGEIRARDIFFKFGVFIHAVIQLSFQSKTRTIFLTREILNFEQTIPVWLS
jgi:hypothetical protein